MLQLEHSPFVKNLSSGFIIQGTIHNTECFEAKLSDLG